MNDAFVAALHTIPELVKKHLQELENRTTTSVQVTANLVKPPLLPELPANGFGVTKTFDHLQTTILPSLAQGHAGPRYYGKSSFVNR
jgi:hypothetical protein